MTYEIVFVDDIEQDFLDEGISDAGILTIQDKLKVISNHQRPLLLTDRVLNTGLRKIPYKNYRVFLYIDENQEVIYCLAVLHHNKCYKKQELKKILSVLRDLKEKN
jgi:mRNA-degrading endonuclease RelE of RelBE toxin-antitoxin system